MADAAERSERATPKRREEARQQGQVVLSPEIAPVAVLLATLGLFSWAAPVALEQSRLLVRDWLTTAGPAAFNPDAVWPLVARSLGEVGRLLGLFLVTIALVGACAVVGQIGWIVTPGLVGVDSRRLSPTAGWRRIFSADGAVTFAKAVLKIAVVLWVASRVFRELGAGAVATPGMNAGELLGFAGLGLRRLLLAIGVALGLLGAADYLWQRWRHEQRLRMTPPEVREELRETEGDPQVKARFRRAHREVARRRMLAAMERADIVLTNPEHVAVALRYRAAEMGAPRVVAKGAGELAQTVQEAARRAGVPVVERRMLARALSRAVEVGAEIPPPLYRGVADLLADLHSLRRRTTEEAR